jgi:hypothetical protein
LVFLKSAAFVNNGRTGSIPVSGTINGFRAITGTLRNEFTSTLFSTHDFEKLSDPTVII